MKSGTHLEVPFNPNKALTPSLDLDESQVLRFSLFGMDENWFSSFQKNWIDFSSIPTHNLCEVDVQVQGYLTTLAYQFTERETALNTNY